MSRRQTGAVSPTRMSETVQLSTSVHIDGPEYSIAHLLHPRGASAFMYNDCVGVGFSA